MIWKNNFEKGKELILATSSKDGKPNANVVISLGFTDGKLLVADCQMNRTINNLKENNQICIIAGYLRIRGTIEIFSSGKYFDLCNDNGDNEHKVKNAVLIAVKEVFDLDKMTVVNLE